MVIGRLPCWIANHSLALSMPSGAVHPNIFQRPVFMGSGLAAARRPGMTGVFTLSVQSPTQCGRGASIVEPAAQEIPDILGAAVGDRIADIVRQAVIYPELDI